MNQRMPSMHDVCSPASMLVTITSLVSFFLFLFPPIAAAAHPEDRRQYSSYTVGVFPFVSLPYVEELFIPVVLEMQRSLGSRVSLRTSSSFGKFMANLADGVYDVAFIQPFDFVRIAIKAGYLPLAAMETPPSANIVVKANSDIENILGLKGKVLGMPPAVAAVSYLTKITLKSSGIDLDKDIELRHLRTHDGCLNELIAGRVDACSIAPFPLQVARNKFDVELRVIEKTQSISSSLFVIHERVPQYDRDLIKQTLLDYNKIRETRSQGKKLRFKPVLATDYADIEEYLKILEGDATIQ